MNHHSNPWPTLPTYSRSRRRVIPTPTKRLKLCIGRPQLSKVSLIHGVHFRMPVTLLGHCYPAQVALKGKGTCEAPVRHNCCLTRCDSVGDCAPFRAAGPSRFASETMR